MLGDGRFEQAPRLSPPFLQSVHTRRRLGEGEGELRRVHACMHACMRACVHNGTLACVHVTKPGFP